MCKTSAFLLLILVVGAPLAAGEMAGDAPDADRYYVFSYFKNNGEDGLHLASSRDGLRWTALNRDRAILKPTVGGDRLMRDPSIVRGPDGTFHMVWTTSWNDRIIGHASSPDLIHWSEQKAIDVMGHEPTARNCWAPEVFHDRASERFWIVWSTTIPGRFSTEGTSETQYDHRMYAVSTTDFAEFTPAVLFYDPGFNVIDGFLAHDGAQGCYLLFYKDERLFPEPKKEIRLATSPRVDGPFETHGVIAPRNWVEGPSALKIGDAWCVYYDCYRDRRYGAIRSTDLREWEDITHLVHFPAGTRHGTALEVDRAVYEGLMKAFSAAE